jgi:DNA-binding transcriptional regulator YiaG
MEIDDFDRMELSELTTSPGKFRIVPEDLLIQLLKSYDVAGSKTTKSVETLDKGDASLGKLIRRHRQIMGLSTQQLSDSIDITVGTLSRWENDHHAPTPSKLLRLITTFGTEFRIGLEFLKVDF